ncbi:MAG TPA: type IV pili methyl-accepting chemotaxis transducer N-terminal domain-containing protein [Roseateles sp.]|nr:type IV pili methyl-accepting chemotaxis transducer N-terminal domain-containing protein [Roseateles sp.]
MPEPTDLPQRVLLLGPPETPLPAWDCTVLVRAGRHSLVQDAREAAADALLLWLPDGAALDAWLDALGGLKPELPGVCIAPGASAAQQQRGLALGLQVWLESAPPAPELQALLRWAIWQADWQARRLAALQAQLDERKWTERAKGLLMNAREIDEESAFRLLRETAMHAQLRLGEVARSVVQAAQLAEAVNLAGQQRMLSQRLVKLMAQRAAGLEARRAKTLQDESAARVDANLARLPALLPAALDIAGLTQAWAALRPLLTGKPTAAVLGQADAAAEALLALSEQFTNAIEAAGAGRPLRLVNLCGRQRMLSQRLAKEALLADLLPGRDPALLSQLLSGFESGLAELEAAPLASPAIRALLDEVREEWLRLLRSLRDVQGPEAAAGLARSSEVLLSRLDMLTAQYQQSLQLILG